MGHLLSPRDAAARLGITVDTLRRWDREGLIDSERTPGGQRRYSEEDIGSLLEKDNRKPQTHRTIPVQVRRSAPLPRANPWEESEDERDVLSTGAELPPWEKRVREERADLEVTKLRRERESIIRLDRQAIENREWELEVRRLGEERRQAEFRKDAALREQERQRLEALRAYGRNYAWLAPLEQQALVARELTSYVTSEQFPGDIGETQSRQLVTAHVDQVLAPWKERTQRDRAVASLLAMGRSFALASTMHWQYKNGERARKECERALREAVDHTWEIEDVRALVVQTLEDQEDE